MNYIPQVDDYVVWKRPGHSDEGWVYFKFSCLMTLLASKSVLKINLTVNILRMKNTRRFTFLLFVLPFIGRI